VLDLGIAPDTPLDLALVGRVRNLAAAIMAVVSVTSAAATWFDAGIASVAMVNLFLATLYVAVLALGAAGSPDGARWLLVVTAVVHFFTACVAFGSKSPFPFYAVLGVTFLVIGFARSEVRKAQVAAALGAACWLVTLVASAAIGPLTPLPDAAARNAFYVTLFTLMSAVGYGLYYFKNASLTARLELADANRRISELLAAMVPAPIALRLARGDRLIADSHGEATVLFADLTGFSQLTRRLSPTHLVEVLNLVFSRFDEAARRHRIEKIKTIGDCYMAATGVLDDPVGGAGVEAMAEFALDMLDIVERTSEEIHIPLGMRIGISTGPVVSGVIGEQRFAFDVWGDTVNLANRMESSSAAGQVQVSEATYWRVRGRYRFDVREDVEVKGGERIRAYVLVGREPKPAAAAAGA
jgi:class 3 adenylate cyclase